MPLKYLCENLQLQILFKIRFKQHKRIGISNVFR